MITRITTVATMIALFLIGTATVRAQAMLEEVVVTAQKRAESLGDVPISVSAFTGDLINEAGVRDIRDIAGLTPGLSIKSRGETETTVFIRGIGSQAPGIGADPAVGIFIDGVSASRGTNASAMFFDLDRIEVVKGPQGTLFGRNASAGAIAIHTMKPDLEANSGSVLLGYGDEGQARLEAIGNFVVNDRFAIRIGGKHDERDGLYYNELTDTEHLGRDHNNLRLSGLYEGDAWESHFVAEYIDFENWDIIVTDADAFADTVRQNAPPEKQSLESWRMSWNNTWSLANGMDLTSITGYYTHDVSVTPLDADETEFPVITFAEPQNAKMFSQELRLNGSTDTIDWFVGGSYIREDLDFINAVQYDEFIVADIFGLNADIGGADGDACNGTIDIGEVIAVPGCITATETPFGDNRTTSWAVYGDMRWNATDRFGVTVGARYTKDKKRMIYGMPDTGGLLGALDALIFGPITDGALEQESTWDSFDPRLALDYFINDDAMVYASIARGYKAGGLNRQVDAFRPDPQNILPFDPEENTAYEIGYKGTFADGRAEFNIAAYYNDYQNFQLEELVGLVPQVTNVGDIETKGIDLDFRALVTDNLELIGSYGYLDAETDQGQKTPQSAENSASLSFRYALPLDSGSEFQLYGSWQYTDSFWFDLANTLEQPSTSLINGRIAYVGADGNWSIALIGENLTDEEYFTERFLFLDVANRRAVGRLVRAEVKFNF